jgi:pyruvate dehydrogenase E2 component (dihydrolipoamide acetyltransferase)
MANIKTLELKIPNLGDAESTEIIEVNVKVGDKISINDPLIVLESEKAAMEVPSDFAGEISELLVSEGENVSEGQIYAKIIAEENLDHKQNAENEKVTSEKTESQETEAEISNVAYDFSGINAGPAVRKYARELEIDLAKITGSGKNSRITKDDLKNFIHSSKQTDSMSQLPLASDFEEFGSYEVLKLSKIRALGAKNLASAWTAIPHVTHFEEIDLSKINELRNVSKLSPLSYLVKCIANNLLEFKEFNASLLQNDEILLKNYINMGIAVDTPNGLVVPVIKNANKLSIEEINSTIKTLAEKAINKKLLSKDLIGATFTVSSLGKIGGVGFTPIINSPEVAIIGISRTKKVLKMQDQKVREVDILPISLSYDHRVINGADAGRFMDNLKNMIENYSE